MNTALKGNIHSDNKVSDDATKEEPKIVPNPEDVSDDVIQEERNNLSDSNILQYEVPSFEEEQILGKLFSYPSPLSTTRKHIIRIRLI